MFRCSAHNFLGVGEAPAGEAGAPADGYAHAHIPAPKPARAVWLSSVHFGHHFHPFLGQFFLALKQKRPVSFVRGCALCFPPISPRGAGIFFSKTVCRGLLGPFPVAGFPQKTPLYPGVGVQPLYGCCVSQKTEAGCVLIGSNPQPVADLPKAWQRHSRARPSFRRGLPPVSMIHAKALHLNRKAVFSTFSVDKIYLASSP